MIRSICLAALAANVATHTLAGPLTPPPGAPSPTNLTLQEIEPRTPISSPTIINQPGSYYLTNNINTTSRGVEIQATGVILDLNGFTITGDGVGTTSEIGVLVSVSGNELPVVVKNGFVRNFTGDGVNTSSSNNTLVVENVHVVDCNSGIASLGPAQIRDCVVRNCAADGFRISSTGIGLIVGCIAESNGSDGFQLDNAVARDCVATNNADRGFNVSLDSLLIGCVATLNFNGFVASTGSTFKDCLAASNDVTGFTASTASSFTDCVARNNGDDGFIAANGVTFDGCTARQNGNQGFDAGAANVFTNCAAVNNAGDGFALNSDCRINFCVADNNGAGDATAAGIRGSSDCTIDSCTVTDNPTGIISGVGALVIRNTAAGNTTANYDIASSDHGAIVAPAGSFSTSNSFANISY
ncbi:MAG: right-handed parallel beta-helix repeat-containing protein [Planctomycetota bacterium]